MIGRFLAEKEQQVEIQRLDRNGIKSTSLNSFQKNYIELNTISFSQIIHYTVRESIRNAVIWLQAVMSYLNVIEFCDVWNLSTRYLTDVEY